MQQRNHRTHVGRGGRAETAVAAAVVAWAQRTATGVGDRAQTGNALGDGDAGHPGTFAFRAHRRRRQPGFAPDQQCSQGVEQLPAVDRTAAKFVVDAHVRRRRGGGGQGLDVVGPRVDHGRELGDIGEVAQRLDAAGGGAGPDRDQHTGLLADLADPALVGRGGDRALYQGHVIGAADDGAGGLGEGGDPHLLGQGQQLVLAVEQRELAAVAGGELPDRQARRTPASLRSRLQRHLQFLDFQQRCGHVVADHGTVAAQQ